jgi:hypothetical protein
MKKSFSYRGAASWNNLPNDVANNYKELSIRNFKTLINNYFTNLERNSVCMTTTCGADFDSKE